MIRCTIDLLPGGDSGRARTIGLVEITNVVRGGLEHPDGTGDYAVVLTKTPPFAGALRAAWRKGRLVADEGLIAGMACGDWDDMTVARVAGHHRSRRGSYDLLYRALRACGLAARNPPDAAAIWHDMAFAPGTGWQPDGATIGPPVALLTAGGRLVKARYHAGAVVGAEGPCGAWIAEEEGQHPPCWTDGICWERNAEGEPSDSPIAWMPLPEPVPAAAQPKEKAHA